MMLVDRFVRDPGVRGSSLGILTAMHVFRLATTSTQPGVVSGDTGSVLKRVICGLVCALMSFVVSRSLGLIPEGVFDWLVVVGVPGVLGANLPAGYHVEIEDHGEELVVTVIGRGFLARSESLLRSLRLYLAVGVEQDA